MWPTHFARRGTAACVVVVAWLAGCGARSELDPFVEPPAPLEVQAITLGGGDSCALLSDGTAARWGYWYPGPSQSRPIEVTTPVDIALLECGGGACAVLHDGTLVCWGELTGLVRKKNVPVVVGRGYAAVSLGDMYQCALLVDGTVECWGQDSGGRLGNASAVNTLQLSPGVPVEGLHDAVAVSAGGYFTCALRAGGTVVCWGEGPLGDGAKIELDDTGWPVTPQFNPTPVEVKGLPGPVKQIAVGFMHACALVEDGTVACWGRRHWALGLDPATFTDSTGVLPEPVAGLPKATLISAGEGQSCAVLEDATVQCWGTNFLPYHGSSTPKPVPGLGPTVAVASGMYHNCALLVSGGVVCWGGNDWGQLGNGTMMPSDCPVPVVGIP